MREGGRDRKPKGVLPCMGREGGRREGGRGERGIERGRKGYSKLASSPMKCIHFAMTLKSEEAGCQIL